MSRRIILFSIGSIQNFIINSRKVCDLSNSSKILSLLINEGIKFIEKKNGQIVLPILNEKSYKKNQIPNYFIMMYKNDISIGKKVEEYVRKTYKKMINDIDIDYDLKSYNEQIGLQLDSSLDIYWVEHEIPNDFTLYNSQQYKKIYEEIYEYLEAVKNIKRFVPISEEGKKCSICGCRNSILANTGKNKKDYKLQKIYKYKDKIEEQSLFKLLDKIETNLSLSDIEYIKFNGQPNYISDEQKKLKEEESLCSVCLLKRFFNKHQKQDFSNSLAQIALKKYIEKNKRMESYINYIQNACGNLDKYECVYRENWDDFLQNCNKNYLEKRFKEIDGSKLPKYYCLYRMDIDNLGKWMSGKYKKNIPDLYGYQKKLSQRINKFFSQIKESLGDDTNLIYAGGDDMMALLPVDSIYKFEQIVYQKFEEEIKKEEYKNITYSQGIFIVHYKTPLGEVVRVSREELESVKEKFKEKVNFDDSEKNATIISIMVEGYSNRNVYFKNNIDNERTMDFIWNDLIKYFEKTKSSYFHTELENEFLPISEGIKEYEEYQMLQMFSVEQKRIMKRSLVDKKNVNEKIDKINDKLIRFLCINRELKGPLDFNNYFNLFYIIKKLKQNMIGE